MWSVLSVLLFLYLIFGALDPAVFLLPGRTGQKYPRILRKLKESCLGGFFVIYGNDPGGNFAILARYPIHFSRLCLYLFFFLSLFLSYFSLSIIILLDYLLVFCSRHNCFISSFLFFSFFLLFLSLFPFSFLAVPLCLLPYSVLRLPPYYYPTPTPSVLFLSFFFFFLLLLPTPGLFCVVCFPLTTRLC